MKPEPNTQPSAAPKLRRTILENRNWAAFAVVFEPTLFEVVLKPGTMLLVEWAEGELEAISFDEGVAYLYCFAERAIVQDLQGHELEVVFDLSRASGPGESDSSRAARK